MPPVGVGASRFASALETGAAKLWVLLIGVNEYQDTTFPSLKYAAIDCHGIGKALAAATEPFPHKEFLIHHDLVAQTPRLATVESSLHRVVTEAKVQDTILIYFSGHGVVEPIHQGRGYANGQQTILCLYDTDREQLLTTGLPIQTVLDMLRHCAAHSQLLWLDACHSGNMRSLEQSSRAKMEVARDRQSVAGGGQIRLNPTTQLLASLRQAVNNHGFYALLSCDEGQQSWEFPDLGHGVFSYYLMLGLGGEAADAQGIIDADGLYRYVYRQTMQYIDKTNQQVRLANQVRRERGEMSFAPEYSPQTPKRIVSGVGEIILGVRKQAASSSQDRSALIIDGGTKDIQHELATLSHVLEQEWQFSVDLFAQEESGAKSVFAVEDRIQTLLGKAVNNTQDRLTPPLSTRLLYLRGQIIDCGGEAAGSINENMLRLRQNWLGQKLSQSHHDQQILIIDAPGATPVPTWVEALTTITGNLSIIGCASPADDSELFLEVLIEALISTPPQVDLPIVSLFTRVQTTLDTLGISCHVSLPGTQSSIEILPEPQVPTAELPPELVIQTEISLPSADREFTTPTDTTFGQDYTYFQPDEIETSTTSTTFRANLESILSKLVGPIAPALIKRSQAENPTTTIENLRLLLPPQFRDVFSQQAQSLLVKPPTSTPPKLEQQVREIPASSPSFHTASGRGITIQPHVGVDESLIRAYEDELNMAIGPISKFIIASTRKAHPHLSAPDFIAALASNITDRHRADLFRQKCKDRS